MLSRQRALGIGLVVLFFASAVAGALFMLSDRSIPIARASVSSPSIAPTSPIPSAIVPATPSHASSGQREAASLRVSVRDAVTRSVISSASVVAGSQAQLTDALGEARVDTSATSVLVRHSGYAPMLIAISSQDRTGGTIEAQLQPGAGIRGTVSDLAGKPLAGVPVALATNGMDTPLAPSESFRITRASATGYRQVATTDENGRYAFDAVSSGWHALSIAHHGYALTSTDKDSNVNFGVVVSTSPESVTTADLTVRRIWLARLQINNTSPLSVTTAKGMVRASFETPPTIGEVPLHLQTAWQGEAPAGTERSWVLQQHGIDKKPRRSQVFDGSAEPRPSFCVITTSDGASRKVPIVWEWLGHTSQTMPTWDFQYEGATASLSIKVDSTVLLQRFAGERLAEAHAILASSGTFQGTVPAGHYVLGSPTGLIAQCAERSEFDLQSGETRSIDFVLAKPTGTLKIGVTAAGGDSTRNFIAHIKRDGEIFFAFPPDDSPVFTQECDPGVYEVTAYDLVGRILGTQSITIPARGSSSASFSLEM